MPIATHQISLHGLSGTIFWFVMSAVMFYVLGFATVDWERTNPRIGASQSIGLWRTCSGSDSVYREDWFKAVQAMASIGLACLLAAMLAIFIYMFIHSTSISKNSTIIAFVVLSFIAAVSMLIAFCIFGSKHNSGGELHWSFAFAVIGGILTLIAGILGLVQMRQSNVC